MIRVGFRNGRKEFARVGMPGCRKKRFRGSVFHNDTVVHDGNLIGQITDNVQIV